jgi:serine/threonine protein kinase
LKNIPHDESADMWSVGVIIYVLLVGYPPFMEDDQQELFRKIRTGSFEFYAEDWAHISQEAKDLVEGLLVVDPLQRFTAQAALRSPWIRLDDMSVSNTALTETLRVIRERRQRLRSVTNAVMWMSKDAKADPVPHSGAMRSAGSSTSSGLKSLVLQ